MQTLTYASNQCLNCGFALHQSARFCGGCGSLTQAEGPAVPPSFAKVQPLQAPAVNKELQDEASRLLMQLARERVLLLFHWATFIGLNFIGIYFAMKCYNEFLGDELSKVMIASTPFLFINSMALLGIILIKGTRTEIARLKERISYVKFKIEFGHLM